ncbi:collagen alpha-4(vi) chain, partial [Plakobranchus ocellatus]
MIADPDDPGCCSIPQCDPGTGQTVTGMTGKVTGFGTLPTSVTGTPIYGTYTPVPRTNTCVYKGVAYASGQRWRDGCDYSCECLDGITGRYECVEICATYPNPDGCPMVREPLNPCCLVPSCTPDPQATPVPAPTPYPLQVSTLVPQTAFCMYQGRPYKQYAEWHDGCDLNCRCEDATLNQINCDQRCPDYANFPQMCRLMTDPNDACCHIPLCVPTPGATPSPNMTVTGVRGTFTGNSGTPTDPNKQDTCVYHGVTYNQGDSWMDGCSYNCTCEGKGRGLYACIERCNRYPVVPQGCRLTSDRNDACCEVLDCSPGAFLSPTPSPRPGYGSSTIVPRLADMCVYNGQTYRQDQVWYDGCSLLCTCDDASNNFYTCRNRCPQYEAVDRSCVMIPDPLDPTCCTTPNCPLLQPGPLPTPGPVTVTQSPGRLVGIGMVPTPTPMVTPEFYTGTTPVPPTPQPGCMYKGQLYRQTDQWSDGCDWNCECLDENSGLFNCTSRCPAHYFNNLPQQCVLVEDPKDACCSIPYCDFIHPTPFPNGLPTLVPGQAPINITGTATGTQGANDVCVYGGSFFRQGESWNDGCDLSCVCDDAAKGFYTCRQRCGDYLSLPDTCKYITDPSDQCCLIPSCIPPNNPTPTTGNGNTVAPNYVITPAPPMVFTGRGGQPQQPNGPGSTGYSSQTYQQSQDFDDGCLYKCTCVDALYGKFRCTERCAKYKNLPPSCRLVEDPNDICCQVPECPTPIPTLPTTTSPATPTSTRTTKSTLPLTPAPTSAVTLSPSSTTSTMVPP